MREVLYENLWRNKWLTSDAKTLDDFIEMYEAAAERFREWKKAGITLDPESGISDDYAIFLTTDPVVAERFGFDRQEYEDDEESEEEESNE